MDSVLIKQKGYVLFISCCCIKLDDIIGQGIYFICLQEYCIFNKRCFGVFKS